MTDINKKIIEETTNYCENVKYVRRLDKYFCDLQRDFKALTSKLPVLLNYELINKDDFLFDLEISMDDLAIQIQSVMFKIQQIEDNNIIEKGLSDDKRTIDDKNFVKQLFPLLFTYLMAIDKKSIINKKKFKNTFDSLLQTQSTAVNTNVGSNSTDVFIPPFIELD